MTEYRKLLESVGEHYALKALRIQLLHNGTNKVFRIGTDNTELILKLFPKKSRRREDIKKERDLMTYLLVNGISCPAIVEPLTLSKEALFTHGEVEYYGIMMHEQHGKSIGLDNDPCLLFLLGEALSKLHKIQPPTFLSGACSFTYPSELMTSLEEQFYQPQCNILPLITDLYESFGTLHPHDNNMQPASICHGDAWPGNGIFGHSSCILIDFEHARLSLPIFDIATFLWWVLGHNNRDYAQLMWTHFKTGYGTEINSLLNSDLSTLLKINELRSLIFLYKNTPLSEGALASITHKCQWFTTILKSNLTEREIWKLA